MFLLIANWFPFFMAGCASLFGLLSVVRARFNAGLGWHVEGGKARLLGLLLVPTLPLLLCCAAPPFSAEVVDRDFELRQQIKDLQKKLAQVRDQELQEFQARIDKSRLAREEAMKLSVEAAKKNEEIAKKLKAEEEKQSAEEKLRRAREAMRLSVEDAKTSEENAKKLRAERERQAAEEELCRREKKAELETLERELLTMENELRMLNRPDPDQLRLIFAAPHLWILLVVGLSWLVGVKSSPAQASAAADPPASGREGGIGHGPDH